MANTAVGSITTSGATVTGDVNPNRVATTYKVEYGTTVSYGSVTTPVAAGAGSSVVAASVPLTGLASTTTYHARLVAVSAGGTTNGPDLVFTTGDIAPSVTGTVGGLDHDGRRDRVGQREPEPRRDDLHGRVRHDGVVRVGDDAGVRRLRLWRGRGERAADGPDLRRRPTTRGSSRRARAARRTARISSSPRATSPPSVSGTAVGSVTTTGATVSGNVNPNRVATTYRVEYGSTVAYGSVTAATSAGSGASAVAASVPLTGLSLSSTYHARLVAISAGGTTNGPDLVFTTGTPAPSVSGTSAGSITTTGATVSGSVTPNGVATSYSVEYGTTTGYGSATTPVSSGAGTGAVAVERPADRSDVLDDLPRTPHRDERGRDDERP